MHNRTLSLKREALADLTPNELGLVAAGQQALTHLGCGATDGCTHGPTFDQACPTLPLNPCLSPLIADTILCK